MCGAGVARSWCRRGSGGAWNSQLYFGYVITGIFKDPFGHHDHHHHHHYRGALYNKDNNRNRKLVGKKHISNWVTRKKYPITAAVVAPRSNERVFFI